MSTTTIFSRFITSLGSFSFSHAVSYHVCMYASTQKREERVEYGNVTLITEHPPAIYTLHLIRGIDWTICYVLVLFLFYFLAVAFTFQPNS